MFEVRLLGQFQVRRAGQIVEINTRPAQSLFAYLNLNASRPHRREYLAGLLWPSSEEAQARRNLRQALWQLRRNLADDALIQSDDVTVTFTPPLDLWLDAAVIEAEIDLSAPVEQWIAVVQSYGGELLPGFYDDWVTLERERLNTRFETKIEGLLDHLARAHRWSDTVRWAEHWIATGNAPEPAFRALMHAYGALGNTAKVAETYQRCVEALKRLLDVAPSPQTRDLFETLSRPDGKSSYPAHVASGPSVTSLGSLPSTANVRPDTQPSRPRRHNLPAQVSSFVGREGELASIRQQLSEARLLTLTGPAGMGKTRLALQAAQSVNDDYPDGVWLVELAPVKDPTLVPQSVGTLFEIAETPGRSITRALIDTLRDRSLLIVLDNCEQVIEASAALVETLLHSCPTVRILATSRERLGITGETVFRIPAMTVPKGVHTPSAADAADAASSADLTDLAGYESVRLLIDRARAVEPGFALTQGNAPAITRLCSQLDGMPLAIELVAARVHTMSMEQIVARLDDRFRLLSGGSRTAPPRHQTLRALIDWSWDLLTEAEQLMLRRLSVFNGGWTLEAAEAISLDPNALELLTRLVEKSLVRVETQAAETRYVMLETIRLYASGKLLESDEGEALRERHINFFAQLAESAEVHLRAASQVVWLARIDADIGNMRAALERALYGDHTEASLKIAGNLYRYWYFRGIWAEGRHWLKHALAKSALNSIPAAQATRMLKQARVKALCGAGWLADEDGSEIPLYQEAIVLSRECDDVWSEAFACRGIVAAEINWLSQDPTRHHLHHSLALFESLRDEWGIGLTHYTLGWCAITQDAVNEAESHWQEALRRFQTSGDRWGIAVSLNSLGLWARMRGEYARAARLVRESLSLYRELGDKSGVATSLRRLAGTAMRRGNFAEAATLLQESLTDQRGRADTINVVSALIGLGLVTSYQGDYARAEAMLQEALTLAQTIDARLYILEILDTLALNAYHQHDLTRAQAYWQESLTGYRALSDTRSAAFVEHQLGLIAFHRGDLERAAQLMDIGLGNIALSNDIRLRSTMLQNAAKLAIAQGDVTRAKQRLQESLSLHEQCGDAFGIVRALEQAAQLISAAQRSTRLLATASAIRQRIASPLSPIEQPEIERHLELLRQQLGQSAFEAAWACGLEGSMGKAIQDALQALRPEP